MRTATQPHATRASTGVYDQLLTPRRARPCIAGRNRELGHREFGVLHVSGEQLCQLFHAKTFGNGVRLGRHVVGRVAPRRLGRIKDARCGLGRFWEWELEVPGGETADTTSRIRYLKA